MADHATVDAPASPLSPKVLWPLLVGLGLTGLAAILGAITPEMLAGLGPWAGMVFVLVTAASQAVTGYLKRDPLRDLGHEAANAPAAPPVEAPVPAPASAVGDGPAIG